MRFPIDEAGDQHDDAPAGDALRERTKIRVSRRGSRRLTISAKPMPVRSSSSREKDPRAGEAAHAPDDVGEEKGREDGAGPQQEFASECGHGADGDLSLDEREFGGREEGDGGAF